MKDGDWETGDERFADMVVSAVATDRQRDEVRLAVEQDMADGAAEIVLEGVEAVVATGFGRQNVVGYLAHKVLGGADLEAFVDYARRSGAGAGFGPWRPLDDPRLCLILVPANGMELFAVCRSIEKRDVAGRALHRVEA